VRTALIVAYRLALTVAWISLLYLLFIFGHTETASPARILTVCAVAGSAALVAGLLQWVGLPGSAKSEDPKKGGRKPTKRNA
jgi:hypothetical protein